MTNRIPDPVDLWSFDERVGSGPMLKWAVATEKLQEMLGTSRTGKMLKAIQNIPEDVERASEIIEGSSAPSREALVHRYNERSDLDTVIQKTSGKKRSTGDRMLLAGLRGGVIGSLLGGEAGQQIGRVKGIKEVGPQIPEMFSKNVAAYPHATREQIKHLTELDIQAKVMKRARSAGIRGLGVGAAGGAGLGLLASHLLNRPKSKRAEMLKDAQWAWLGKLIGRAARPGGLVSRAGFGATGKALGQKLVTSSPYRNWMLQRQAAAQAAQAAQTQALRAQQMSRLNEVSQAASRTLDPAKAVQGQAAMEKMFARVGGKVPAGPRMAYGKALPPRVMPSKAPASKLPVAGESQILPSGTKFIDRRVATTTPAPTPAAAPTPGAGAAGAADEGITTIDMTGMKNPTPGDVQKMLPAGAELPTPPAPGMGGMPGKPGIVDAYKDVFSQGGIKRLMAQPGMKFNTALSLMFAAPQILGGNPLAGALGALAPLPAFRAGFVPGMAASFLAPSLIEKVLPGSPPPMPEMPAAPQMAQAPTVNVNMPNMPAAPRMPSFTPGAGAFG